MEDKKDSVAKKLDWQLNHNPVVMVGFLLVFVGIFLTVGKYISEIGGGERVPQNAQRVFDGSQNKTLPTASTSSSEEAAKKHHAQSIVPNIPPKKLEKKTSVPLNFFYYTSLDKIEMEGGKKYVGSLVLKKGAEQEEDDDDIPEKWQGRISINSKVQGFSSCNIRGMDGESLVYGQENSSLKDAGWDIWYLLWKLNVQRVDLFCRFSEPINKEDIHIYISNKS